MEVPDDPSCRFSDLSESIHTLRSPAVIVFSLKCSFICFSITFAAIIRSLTAFATSSSTVRPAMEWWIASWAFPLRSVVAQSSNEDGEFKEYYFSGLGRRR